MEISVQYTLEAPDVEALVAVVPGARAPLVSWLMGWSWPVVLLARPSQKYP